LVVEYETVLPEADLVEIMSSQGRTMAPLIAGEQQRQISATNLQHIARLQSQKQLTESLLEMLASAGSSPPCYPCPPVHFKWNIEHLLYCLGFGVGKREPQRNLGRTRHHYSVCGDCNTFQGRLPHSKPILPVNGMCASPDSEREVLQARAGEALGLSVPGSSCPPSPHRDLIPASYPDYPVGHPQHQLAATHIKPSGVTQDSGEMTCSLYFVVKVVI
jgi:hypothetical protein